MHKYEAVSSLNQAYYTLKLYNMQTQRQNLNLRKFTTTKFSHFFFFFFFQILSYIITH